MQLTASKLRIHLLRVCPSTSFVPATVASGSRQLILCLVRWYRRSSSGHVFSQTRVTTFLGSSCAFRLRRLSRCHSRLWVRRSAPRSSSSTRTVMACVLSRFLVRSSLVRLRHLSLESLSHAHPMRRQPPNQAMQLTASKPAIYVLSVCHPRFACRRELHRARGS
jgi:hypothetical protein